MPKHPTIHTKYHKLFGARLKLVDGTCAVHPDEMRSLVDVSYVNTLFSALSGLPRYVIYEDLMALLDDPEGGPQRSLNVMIEHGLARLPFKQVIVEFQRDGEISLRPDQPPLNLKVRHFVWLSETGHEHAIKEQFSAVTWTLVETPEGSFVAISPVAATCDLLSRDQANAHRLDTDPTHDRAGALFHAVLAPYIYTKRLTPAHQERLLDNSLEHAMSPAVSALSILMILLHTKGVVQDQVVVSPKLNKSRAASGKPHIQDHTVIRIGHVYSRSGQTVSTPSGRPYHGQVYWVPGHIRGVRYGPKRSRIYDLFIEPFLVNYRDGDEAPIPKTKEVTT